MATFKTWTHPATGETRVYINDLFGQKHGAKVFVASKSTDEFGCDCDIRAFVPEGVYTRRADLVNEADKVITEACHIREYKFADVLKLAH